CSGYEEVGKTVHGAEHRLATELVIRLIHEYCRLWSDIRQLQKILTRHERSRWIVRAGYGDETCLRTDSGKYLIDGKLEAIIWICLHRNNSRAGALRVDLVHRECRNNDDDFVLRLEKRFTEQVNGFVDAIREQHLWSRQAQVLRYKRFHRRSFWILRQFFCGNALQSFSDFWGRRLGVFVEVEAQAVTSAQRRMILLHLADGFARLEDLLHQASVLTAIDCA